MKTFNNFFLVVSLFLISSKTFPQLDSVYYKGPSQGSVSGGAIQTTDNFTDNISFPESELAAIPPIEVSERNKKDLIFGWDAAQLPEYKYMEDSPVRRNTTGNGGQTVLLNNFPGISMTNFIPPDPVIASGPEHIIICANSTFKIMDKEGNVLKSIAAVSWWAPVWPDESGDPQVIYDHFANRWILVWMQVNSSTLTSGNLIAYSDDYNPLGTWYMYRLDTKAHGTVPSNTWGDYPHVGYDEEAIYISTGCTDFAGGGHLYNKIRIIDKSELYNSNTGPLTYTDLWEIHVPGQGSTSDTIDYIQPGISHTPGNGGWLFWAMGVYNGPIVSSDFYVIYKIINPLTSPVIRGKVLPVQTYTSPPLANQLGGGLGIETIGWITRQPIIKDGYLYTSHDIQNSLHPDYSSMKYLKIDLATVSISENVEYGSEGYFYLFPALVLDKDNNIAVTFSRSADTEYIGAYYTTWHSNDPNGFSPSLPFAEGLGNYVLTYGGTLNRWGDYFGIYLDPANDYDVWMISEYAAGTNIWGTYVGQIRMAPYGGAHAYLAPKSIDFGNVEIGTTSSTYSVVMANYGDTDLIISDIPSANGGFNLETILSFPLTLNSYDSLTIEFSYSPTVLGDTTVLYPIISNDPEFYGITLTGNCYQIIPAIEKTIYACSGLQNNGEIITIDLLSGIGSTVGPSQFSEVKGLAINPSNGIIYGLVANPGNAELIRVNSESGDSYTLFNLSIPALADIAFDTLGTLYAVSINGEIFTINLNNGNTTLVVDAVGSYSGITFHPETNELWATSRAFLPPNKDAIFKVNLNTGDTVIVGHTGLNQLTNDIVFDEDFNLYGIIGTASNPSDFISINTATGAGTIIGSVGMNNILGLAYIKDSPTSIEDDIKENIPADYLLMQNYPNPFNPSTKIRFQIAGFGFVNLKIYDVLGNEVATLLNEDLPAGAYEVEFNTASHSGEVRNLSSGIYFYQLLVSASQGKDGKAVSFVKTKKMIFLK